MPKRQWIMLLVFIVLWVFVTVFNSRFRKMGALPGPELNVSTTNRKLEKGWTLLGPDNTRFDWDQTKDKLVLINVWATWCPPCREELPSLAALAKNEQLKESLVVLCVTTDDRPEQLQSFLKKNSLDMPVYFAPELPNDFVTEAIPATFLLRSDGTLVGSMIGSANWNDLSFVEDLLSLGKK